MSDASWSLLLAAYVVVLTAELLGDKLLYTIAVLSSRHRKGPIALGAVLACSLKTAVAVMLGRVIAELPVWLVRGASVLTFLLVALAIWRHSEPATPPEPQDEAAFGRGLVAAFSAVLFSEWGDVGQITTATLAARYHAPGIIWAGAMLALITKVALAVAVGIGLRRWLSWRTMRGVAITVCLVMVILVGFGVEP
jgi:Ca2+/H+ antiporter, TMEM165/GDT1 family